MERWNVKVCVVRAGGTNCDLETKVAFESLGVKVDLLRTQKLLERGLADYHIVVFPGGFSYGDYVRAGAIWAKLMQSKLISEVSEYVEEGRLLLGICNGFQVLVEMGVLPAFNGLSMHPEAALATNLNARYECRWVYLRIENPETPFTSLLKEKTVIRIPIGHGEGRFLLPKEREEDYLERLIRNRQIVLRYAKSDGEPAGMAYPFNPNGSVYDIAGICNPKGNVFGLMPHPERAFFWWQLPDWTRMEFPPRYGDGWFILESAVSYVCENF
ncbi:phosphoribosylformylglycinamidine synthase I [Candidatus Bathyarchaeota archaeon]|nr:phosphoribosylformylglycinamidine synthase I [Candidatus Bathyarchaeota archaeon]